MRCDLEQTCNAGYGYRRTTPVTSPEKNYCPQLPYEKRRRRLRSIAQSIKPGPNFDEKMSKIVEDRPSTIAKDLPIKRKKVISILHSVAVMKSGWICCGTLLMSTINADKTGPFRLLIIDY